MVDIVTNPEWKAVRILERDEVALGGYGGNMNEQATALVARTELLKEEKADRNDIVQGQYSFATLAAFDAAKTTIPPNSTVVIDQVGVNQGTNTWDGLTLTKSPYDPVQVSKLDATTKVEASEVRTTTKINTLDAKTGVYMKKLGTSSSSGSTVHNSTGVPANRTVVSAYALQQGLLTSIKVRVVVVGDKTLTLMLFKKNSNTSFTNKMKVNVTLTDDVVAGDVVTLYAGVDFPEFDVNETLYLGFYQPTGSARIYYGETNSGAFYSFTGDAGAVDVTQTTYVGSSQALSIEATTEKTPAQINKELINIESAYGYEAKALSEFNKGKTQLRTISFVSGDASTAVNKAVIDTATVKQDGFVFEFEGYVKSGGGSFDLLVCEGTATSQTVIKRIPVISASGVGVQKFVAGKNFEAFKVKRGQRIGLYSTTVRFAYTYTGGGTYTSSTETIPDVGVVLTVIGANSLLQINFTFLTMPKGRQWDGKKAVLIGDSITEIYSGTWINEVKEITGLDIVANYGVNGQVLRTMADSLTVENMTGIDLVLCLGGVNDWHHGSSTLGTPSDTSTANTIYGAVKNIVEKVYAANPNAFIVFATPFNTGKYTTGPEYGATNANGLSIKNIDLAMLDACGDLGIPCFSTRQKSGVNNLNLATMTIDNIHPSSFGGKHFGKIWGEFITHQHPWVSS